MSRCTKCGKGTLTEGFCDYCGFAPPPEPLRDRVQTPLDDQRRRERTVPSRRHEDRTGPSRPRPPAKAAQPDGGGSRRSLRYGPLDIAGVPPVPYEDPETVKLFEPTGPGPLLRPGESVGGQYVVKGCLAHGGVGRIYLAYDTNVGHWVVLKGLLDAGADVADVPEAERAALAAVNDPNIVKIHNFVQYPAPEPGAAPSQKDTESQRYIVMEYVGGRSLRQLLDDLRRSDLDARLPLAHVIAYGIEMLRALGYLHSQGLLYCDLKPANVMQCEDRIILIDLGGARQLNNRDAPIFGTPGFTAADVYSEGPSIQSDLYTVGRTMAVLSFPFDFTGEFLTSLPDRESVPLLEKYDSYYRLLCRATHADPRERFADAAEMEEQLFGVLREVVSVPRNAEPWPMPSTLFGRERRVVGAGVVAAGSAAPSPAPLTPRSAVTALPVPVVSGVDGSPGLAELVERGPREIVGKLSGPSGPRVRSLEERLVLVGALLDLGRRADAEALLGDLADDPHGDWRIGWYRAVATLSAGRYEKAGGMFDRLYALMPGEAAPKLALAFCREGTRDLTGAARHYESVWRTDRGYLSAAFGLARVRLGEGDRDGAVRALDEVPSLSSHYGAAQLAAMAAGLRGRPSSELSREALLAAAKRLDHARIDGELRRRLVAEVLEAGLAWMGAGRGEHPGDTLIGTPLTQRGLRLRLERTYRELAWLATDTDSRHALVDKANAVRPRTIF